MSRPAVHVPGIARAAIAPPIEPMLAKLADPLPRRRSLPVRTEVGRLPRPRLPRRRRHLHPEPRPGAARRYFPSCTTCLTALAAGLRARRRDRHRRRRTGSTSTRCSCACTRPRRASRSSPRGSPSAFVAFDLLAVDGDETCATRRRAERRAAARAAARRRHRRHAPHAGDPRSRRSRPMVRRASKAPASTA